MGQLSGLYFICQIILGLLLFSQWGLFTWTIWSVGWKGKSSFAFFSPKLKLSGDLQFNFLENLLCEKKEVLRKSKLKSQSMILVIKALEVI